MSRRETGILLIVPVIILIAVAAYAGFYLVIKAGNAAVYGWHWLLSALGLPAPIAIAGAFVLAVLTISGVVGYFRRRKPSRKV